jgi:hypothetical protein
MVMAEEEYTNFEASALGTVSSEYQYNIRILQNTLIL